MPRTKKHNKQTERAPTTAQQFGSLIKSARDIMRKDKRIMEIIEEIKATPKAE